MRVQRRVAANAIVNSVVIAKPIAIPVIVSSVLPAESLYLGHTFHDRLTVPALVRRPGVDTVTIVNKTGACDGLALVPASKFVGVGIAAAAAAAHAKWFVEGQDG